MTFFASRVRWKKFAGLEAAIGKSLARTAELTSLNREPLQWRLSLACDRCGRALNHSGFEIVARDLPDGAIEAMFLPGL